MSQEIRLSAKVLGELNMPDFCPACFWLKQGIKNLPFQIFPGIFSSIDAYTKRVMHSWFDMHNEAPPWLPVLKGATGYLPIPHWSKFKRTDPVTGITVSGGMDDLFICEDNTNIIPDYKTAKYTKNQDKLFPLYEGQLNGYTWIHEGITGNKVSAMPLIYCEPVTDQEACTQEIFKPDGFVMGFTVNAINVEKDDKLIPALLQKAKAIIDNDERPTGTPNCDNCKKTLAMVDKVAPWLL